MILSARELSKDRPASSHYYASSRSLHCIGIGEKSNELLSPRGDFHHELSNPNDAKEANIEIDISLALVDSNSNDLVASPHTLQTPQSSILRASNPDLLKIGRADERRRERVKQNTMLQKRVESQRNYSTCKF